MRHATCLLLLLTLVAGPAGAETTSKSHAVPVSRPTPIADSVSRFASGHGDALHQLGTVRPPRSGRAPALLPLLIGAGIGATLGGWVGYGLSEGSRSEDAVRAALGGAVIGLGIGYVISSR